MTARRPHGFTLIEVMVALAITAIALMAGLQATGALTRNATRQSDVLLAQLCADNALAQLRLLRQLPAIGDTAQTCTQAGQAFALEIHVRPTPNPLFRRIDVHMLDPEGQHLLLYTTVMSRL